jgi:arylformamidase
MDLTDAYSNAAHIKDGPKYPDRWAAAAAAFRAAVPGRIGVPYGPGRREVFDLFAPQNPKGTVIFVHGGYWRAFDRTMWSHLAAGVMGQGWAMALPSYDLCPEVRIGDITVQIAKAVEVIAAAVNGPLVLTGHSAGGHLVARMACADVRLNCRDRVRRIVPISGLFDLAPLMQTEMNKDLRINTAEARVESPLHHPRPDIPVSLWVGGAERPVFLDQSRGLAEAWKCPQTIADGKHHFDIIEAFTDPSSDLVRDLLTP